MSYLPHLPTATEEEKNQQNNGFNLWPEVDCGFNRSDIIDQFYHSVSQCLTKLKNTNSIGKIMETRERLYLNTLSDW